MSDTLPYIRLSGYRSRWPKYTTNQYVNRFMVSKLGANAWWEFYDILRHVIDEAYSDAEKEYGRPPLWYNILLDSRILDTPIKMNIYHHTSMKSDDQHFADAEFDLILNEVEKLSQSDKLEKFLSNPITIIITTIFTPYGRGPPFDPHIFFGTDEKAKLPVFNNDNKCIFYALEVSRLYHDQSRYDKLRKQKVKPIIGLMKSAVFNNMLHDVAVQKSKAFALMDEAGVSKNQNSYGIEYLTRIQQFYDQKYPGLYRIVCCESSPTPTILWKGPVAREYQVVIVHEQNHYYGLRSIARFYKCGKYCIDCKSIYQHDVRHNVKCPAICSNCYVVGNGKCRYEKSVNILCEKCNRTFYNKKCYEQHQGSACNRYFKCSKCQKIQLTKAKHVCGEYMCRICRTIHPPDRGCFVQPLKQPEYKFPMRICVYDFETSQDTFEREGITSHEVLFASLRWTCTNCEDGVTNGECKICETKFSNNMKSKSWSATVYKNPLKDFVSFVLYAFKKKTNTVLFAHNGGRFDGHFVLRELYARKLTPKLTMTGMKIYDITIRLNKKLSVLHFRDSYLLMQTPLSALKKTFNLAVEDKMYFPYLYCKRSNLETKLDRLPPVDDYNPTAWSVEKADAFLKWYEENKNTAFVLADALAEYCENDTEILMQAVLAMRRILLNITGGYEVLERAYSVAGMALAVYRCCFLKPETIGIVPESGYERCDKASDKAIKLMEWLAIERKVYIQHAGNGREYKIGNWKVDGFIVSQNKVVEFLGCYHHSHPACCNETGTAINGKLHYDNYIDTMKRLDNIAQLGFDVETIWECELNEKLKSNKRMQDFFNDCQTKGSINPKDAFFGGRTMAHKLFEKVTEEKEITYLDIISLYPFINKSVKYPVGHPEIIIPENVYVEWTQPEHIEHDGLYKVRIIAPRGLLLPLLPARTDYKDPRLLFQLCVKCAQTGSKQCEHDDDSRAWTATISSIELRKALELGYRVKRCFRIWKYNKFENLFEGYVQEFMKMKVESSGYPSTINTSEEKHQWKDIYEHKEGICINLVNVANNPGMRYISKLLLNSLWGKFGQRNNLTHVKICKNPDDYYSIVCDKKFDVHQIIPVSEGVLRVTYSDPSAYVKESPASNVVVALWTTSAARLRLYEFMEMVQRSPGCEVVYTDTDSIILSHPRGRCPIPVGSFLGEMSKEYADFEIIEIVCAGAKQYALLLRHKLTGKLKVVIKIRGITFDKLNEEVLSYDLFKQMVLKEIEQNEVTFEYNRLGPDRNSKILSRKQFKIYKPVNIKGYIEDLVVYPFGY